MFAACLLSFCSGFISLSMEILWIRLFSFVNLSRPQSFAYVLAVYLVGIAIGAYIGKYLSKTRYNLWLISGITLLIASIVNLIGPIYYLQFIHSTAPVLAGGMIIMLTALLCAIIFPIAHHLGAANTIKVGSKISRVYVSNIMGATLGPLFTGFFLLSVVTTQQAFIACATLTFILSLYCLSYVLERKAITLVTASLSLVFGFMLTIDSHYLIAKSVKMLPGSVSIKQIVENQYGIITLLKGNDGYDFIAGGNLYDGTTNLDPVSNQNHIDRVIVMSALVEKPKKVLVIGLSIGTWLKLLTSFHGVESIDVIEINPGYLNLVSQYPAQASALADKRVKLHIDDGRRWLKAHPEKRYDMIVMNTSYHWRAYMTYLLSREFLQSLKSHMNKGAVLGYNSTFSPDALKTAESVFGYAYLYGNYVIAGDFDWRVKLRSDQAFKTLSTLKMDNKLLYPRGEEYVIKNQLKMPLKQSSDLVEYYNQFGRHIEIITDYNLITEFKYGSNLIRS